MKCPYCGEENRDIARFCQRCGRPLVAEPADVATSEAAPTVTKVELEGEAQAPPEAEAPPEPESESRPSAEPEPSAEIEAPVPVTAETMKEPTDSTESEVAIAPPATEAEALGEAAKEAEAQPATPTKVAPAEPEPPVETESGLQEAAEPEEPALTAEAEEKALAAAESPTDETGEEHDTTSTELPTPEPAAPEPSPGGESAPEVQELDRADLLPWSDTPSVPLTLEPGTVLNGRYQVIEVLSSEPEETIYRVRDLQRCPRCGFAGNSPDQAFCASCGAALDQKPEAVMLERGPEQAEEAVEAEVEDRFELDGRMYWVWRETKRPADETTAQMRLDVGLKSVTGQVRELDEDSLFTMIMSRTHESLTGQLALFIVADGMGGHEGGEVASKMAIQTMTDVLVRNVFLPELEGHSLSLEEICHWMEQAMGEANDRVYLARQKRSNDMGTTMTAALLKDWSLCLAHVGDCRAYRWGVGGLEQLTTDHSIVASMIAAGAARPEEIYTHPQRSVIYRCIGDRPTVEVDISVLTFSPGDRLLLCCDGLWEMIHDEGIEEVMLREADPQKACDIMVEQANLAGGTDNISVIVVQL